MRPVTNLYPSNLFPNKYSYGTELGIEETKDQYQPAFFSSQCLNVPKKSLAIWKLSKILGGKNMHKLLE